MTNEASILGELLLKHKLIVASAESCTGGNIAHLITEVAGSSAYFKGSVVSYCDEIKHEVLGVRQETLDEHTAVSQQVAEQMADGAKRLMHADIAVSTTGIAGPGGANENQPVGTVWMGVSSKKGTHAELFLFNGNREEIIRQASVQAIQLVINEIKEIYG
ncbi:MAG: CinA family protein [Paludibacteraceae bacterium]|nr:CinA family protein [Paludibacteraceae bacterium]